MKKNCQPTARRSKARNNGFSLVELMVAMAVGLILTAGLASLFANSSKAGNDLEQSIRQMENGRYASVLLNEDISHAGFYGEISFTDITFTNPTSPCSTSLSGLGWDSTSLTVPTAVRGFLASEAAALACLTNYKTGTSALAIRHLESDSKNPNGLATNGDVYVQTSRCEKDPDTVKFIASTAAADFTLRDFNCTLSNNVRRYVSRIYYIASCNECTGTGTDTIPTLKSAELTGNKIVVTPLAEGIEDLAFDYGFDTDSDGTPDTYLTKLSGIANAANNDWKNVTGIRIYILSRANESTANFTSPRQYSLGLAGTRGPFTDNFKRRAYTTTIRINNIAGPRETT